MATVTIEISDVAKAYMEREVASGRFNNPSALVQLALDQLMNTQWKAESDAKIDEALREFERGAVTVWKKGDSEKRSREYLNERLGLAVNS